MYQFTTTNIINSSLDSNGSTAKFRGSATSLSVSRVGKFLKDNILSISKRAYRAGVLEVAKVTIPTVTAGLVIRLDIDVRLSEQTDSEYANAYLYFKKPVFVEVVATGTPATDATALKNQINGLKDRFGFSYITAGVSGSDVTFTATNFNQRFFDIKVLKEGTSYNTIIDPQYVDVTNSTFSVTTAGKLGFGDDDWMARRIMLPTLDNSRYFGVSKDERPVLGGNYTEYVLRYKIQKDPSDGIVAEGYSVTTHIFYVLSSLTSAFEAAIVSTGVVINTIGSVVSAVTIGGNTYDLSDGTDIQLTATTTPAGVTGGVWTLTGNDTVAGTLDATKISLTKGGVFSISTGHGLADGDTIGVKVEIDGFTKTGDITIQA